MVSKQSALYDKVTRPVRWHHTTCWIGTQVAIPVTPLLVPLPMTIIQFEQLCLQNLLSIYLLRLFYAQGASYSDYTVYRQGSDLYLILGAARARPKAWSTAAIVKSPVCEY